MFVRRFAALTVAPLLLALALVTSAQERAEKDRYGDSADAASRLAKDAARLIRQKFIDARPKVCVFPMGDNKGRMRYDLASTSLDMQGELIEQLIKESGGKYYVVDRSGLHRLATAAGLSPDGVSPGDPEAVAKYLKAIGVDAAVVGSFNEESREAFNGGHVKVSASLVYADGTSDQLVDRINSDRVQKKGFGVPGFNLAFRFSDKEEPEKLYVAKSENGETSGSYHKVYFLNLDPATKGKTYVLRLTNGGKHGFEYVNADPKKEEKRRLAVCLRIDGVNSFYQKRGTRYTLDGRNPPYIRTNGTDLLGLCPNDELGPVIVHPKHATKWVLDGAGEKFSCYEVPGFQKGFDTALKFTLADAKDSIAAEAGAMNSVGLIEAHVYAEKLEGDVRKVAVANYAGGPTAGTKAGDPTPFKVREVDINYYPDPIGVVWVFYRYRDKDCRPNEIPIVTDDGKRKKVELQELPKLEPANEY